MRFWPGRLAAPTEPVDDLVSRFGYTCPICGEALGAAAPVDARTGRFAGPPGMRLEVGQADGLDRYPWRVSALSLNFRPIVSTEPLFTEHDVEYVYLLCGGGHIFPDAAPVLYTGARRKVDAMQRIDTWNMVAAIGGPASGKTYLLLRMLHQNLDNSENWPTRNSEGRVRFHSLTPLERIPLDFRAKMYAEMLSAGHPIPPTGLDTAGTPAGILGDELPDALDAIRHFVDRTNLDGERRANDWGRASRQPIVVRSDARGRRTWTGVADLPGELFTRDRASARQTVKLRSYDSLVWVVDPVVAATAIDRLAEDSLVEDSLAADVSYDEILDGCLRPGAAAAKGAKVVRDTRDQIQIEIGRQLTEIDGLFAAEDGHMLQLLVAVTKCDLIHAALRRKQLTDLGQGDEVVHGVAGYLAFLTDQWGRRTLPTDEVSGSLFAYLHGAPAADPHVRRLRIEQIAHGLLAHYSQPEAFWNLVHVGKPDQVAVLPRPDTTILRRFVLTVPSIGEHLDAALLTGAVNRIHVRDLVMSAIGCGIAYGLGHEAALYKVLGEEWMILRFFLCSPLATVPVSRDDERLSPLDEKAEFPRLHDRSAALAQLLLSVLGKARS